MKKFLSALLSGALLFCLGGCNAGSGDDSSGQAQKTKLTVVLDWLPNTNHTGLYAAQKLGYFDQAGLEVSIQQPPEDGAEALVAAGKAQFGVSVQENLASALSADSPLPVTAVAAILQHNTSGLVSLKEKGIDSPKKLEGRLYACWDTPIEQAILKSVMEKDGGDFAKLNQVPSTVTDTIAALQSDIDLVWIYYAWDGVATKVKGVDTNYFEFRDIDPALDYYTPFLIANDSFLAEQPETAKAFLSAVRKGYEYCIQNPEAAADVICEMVPEIDHDIAVESQRYLAGQYQAEAAQWGLFDLNRWDTFFGWLYDNGVIPRRLPAGAGVTNAYIGQ